MDILCYITAIIWSNSLRSLVRFVISVSPMGFYRIKKIRMIHKKMGKDKVHPIGWKPFNGF